MTDIDRFLSDLSSRAPVPGGGSVAALETAMGAALVAMVANLTIGRKKYAEHEDEAREILAIALELRDRARRLDSDDTEAYGLVAAAMTLPRETEAEQQSRRVIMQEALKGAAGPPLETMKCALAVMELARRLVVFGNRSAVSDIGSAAGAARAGYDAARLNVEINLAAIRDLEFVESVRNEVTILPTLDLGHDEVMRQVVAIIRGDSS